MGGLSRKGLPRKPTLVDCEILRFTHDDRSLNHILQFANITRPGIRLKQIKALLAHRLKALSSLPCETINEVFDQQGDLFSSLPQSMNLNWHCVASVKEAAPEHTPTAGSLQV